MPTPEETPARIEPCLPDAPPAILDLVAALSGATHALGARLHPKSAAALADLVRVTNYYYSNLIEGHNTTPRDIKRAMQDRLDASEDRRNLQIEARAHAAHRKRHPIVTPQAPGSPTTLNCRVPQDEL